jgi:hypothetical protein
MDRQSGAIEVACRSHADDPSTLPSVRPLGACRRSALEVPLLHKATPVTRGPSQTSSALWDGALPQPRANTIQQATGCLPQVPIATRPEGQSSPAPARGTQPGCVNGFGIPSPIAISTIIKTSNVPRIRAVQRHVAADSLVVFIMLSIRLQLFTGRFPWVTKARSFP